MVCSVLGSVPCSASLYSPRIHSDAPIVSGHAIKIEQWQDVDLPEPTQSQFAGNNSLAAAPAAVVKDTRITWGATTH